MSTESRINENNKYDGSQESKERLMNLFYITKGNIQEYVNYAKQYRTYLANTLNAIEEDRKESNIENYSDVVNRVLKITETKNMLDIVRLLFNALTSFNAFKGYIYHEIKNCTHKELQPFLIKFKPLLTAKYIDTDLDFDLSEFLLDVRNTYVHNGKYVAKLGLISSGIQNHLVPSVAIQVKDIWNKEHLEKNNIPEDCVIDTLEVFEKYLKFFNEVNIEEILKV